MKWRPPARFSAYWVEEGLFLCIIIIWLPLLLQKIASPIQAFDYLASFPDEAAYVGDWLRWNSFIPNLLENLLHSQIHFRPFGFSFMHFLVLTFGSGYYLQFAVKFLLHAVLVLLIFKIVKLRTGSLVAAYVGGIFLIVHPAPLNLMLYSGEGLVALALVATLWVLLRYVRVWESDAISGEMILDAGQAVRWRWVALALLFCTLVSGLKDNGILLSVPLFVILWIWLVSKQTKPVAKVSLLFLIIIFTGFCVYRVASVRQYITALMGADLSLKEALAQVPTRLLESLQYLLPIQYNAAVGPFVAVVLSLAAAVVIFQLARGATLSSSWKEFGRVLFSLDVVLFGLLIVAVVSVSIPSGYPPRVSPRYLIPSISVLAIIVATGLAPLFRRLPAVGVLTSIYLLLAAPNVMFARENEWSAFNNMFSVFTNRVGELLDAGNKVYVGPESEFGRTLLHLFAPDGRRLFGNKIGSIRRYVAAEAQSERFVLVSFRQPNEFLRSELYTLEKIETVTAVIPESTGFAKLVRVWQKVGRALGGLARPYLESGTVSLERRPLMYIYHLCPRKAEPACHDVLTDATEYGNFCTDLDQVPLAAAATKEGWTAVAGTEQGFRRSFKSNQDAVDRIVVVMGQVRVARAVFRVEFAKNNLHLWQGWLYPNSKDEEFEMDGPILGANTGPYQIDLLAYPGEAAALQVKCPLRVLGVPARVLRAPTRLGSFSG